MYSYRPAHGPARPGGQTEAGGRSETGGPASPRAARNRPQPAKHTRHRAQTFEQIEKSWMIFAVNFLSSNIRSHERKTLRCCSTVCDPANCRTNESKYRQQNNESSDKCEHEAHDNANDCTEKKKVRLERKSLLWFGNRRLGRHCSFYWRCLNGRSLLSRACLLALR
jgi:hypothetical protein